MYFNTDQYKLFMPLVNAQLLFEVMGRATDDDTGKRLQLASNENAAPIIQNEMVNTLALVALKINALKLKEPTKTRVGLSKLFSPLREGQSDREVELPKEYLQSIRPRFFRFGRRKSSDQCSQFC